MRLARASLGQASSSEITAPTVANSGVTCPSGYSLSAGASTALYSPGISDAAEAAVQSAYCVNSKGNTLGQVQAIPMQVVYVSATLLALLFLPGGWKLVAVVPGILGALDIYCTWVNPAACIISM